MQAETVRRATSYPYHIPAESYLLEDSRWSVLPKGAASLDLSNRRPVLACGSNQSPEQLARKFDGHGLGPVPVTRARLDDFDAVYSAHFSRYGAIPATLQRAPGTTVALSVTWLTPDQEARMHETEAVGMNYDFGRLTGVFVAVEGGPDLDTVYAYISRWGCLTERGQPVALDAVEASGRSWSALDQEQVLDLARGRLAPEEPLGTFIGQGAASAETRRGRSEALAATGEAFSYAGFERLEM